MGMRVWVAGLMLTGAALSGGCATAPGPGAAPLPPAKTLQTADLPSLTGEWVGRIKGKPLTGAPTY